MHDAVLSRAHARARNCRQHLGRAADAREGVQSFLEKRPARFTNKVSSDLPPYFPWWEDPQFE